MRKLRFIWLLALALYGCEVEKGKIDEPALEFTIGSEESVVIQCSPWIYERPGTKAQEEQNALVEFIIESRWLVEKTAGGIFYEIKMPGGPKKPTWGDKVRVHYVGRDLEQHVFDSSFRRGKPLEFYVGNVIPGWNEVLPMLGEKGRGIFIIPANMAYGDAGFGDLVPPDQDLIFDITLLEILEEVEK